MHKLIVTGSHLNVLDDIFRIDQYWTFDFMAIGLDAVDKYSWNIKYVATYHPDDIPLIKDRRAKIGGNTDYLIISHVEFFNGAKVDVDIVEPYEPPSGSSALLGTLAAIRMGYDKIILCGCPLIGRNDKNQSYEDFREGWIAKKNVVIGKVKSMSGWTKEFLGGVTEEWLKEK